MLINIFYTYHFLTLNLNANFLHLDMPYLLKLTEFLLFIDPRKPSLAIKGFDALIVGQFSIHKYIYNERRGL